jgi:hypothetical protein
MGREGFTGPRTADVMAITGGQGTCSPSIQAHNSVSMMRLDDIRSSQM